MLKRFRKFTPKKKIILIVITVIMISGGYLGYVGISNTWKWGSYESEVEALGGHFIYGDRIPQGNTMGKMIYSIPGQYLIDLLFPVIKLFTTRTGISCYDAPLSDDLIKRLPESSDFHYLILGNTDITDETVRHITKFPNLRKLVLTDCQLTGKNFEVLQEFTQLKRLYVYGTDISDNDIREIALIPNLEELNLSNTAISDECIEHLLTMKSLRILNISGTKISTKGKQKLQIKMPECFTFAH